MSETEIKPPEVCKPVDLEGGLEALSDPGFEEVVAEVGERVEATFGRVGDDPEGGAAAKRALELACLTCEASDVCVVKQNLENRVAASEGTEAVRAKSEMIVSAPDWLRTARESLTGLGRTEWQEVQRDPSLLSDVNNRNDPNQLSLDAFLGGVTNEPAGVQRAADFPELDDVKNIDMQTTKFDNATRITTENGQTYLVVDASQQVDFKDHSLTPNEREYGILTAKLLDRMAQTDAEGNPQIFSPDNTQQKAIDSETYEMRMANKNRLHFKMIKNPDDETTARIVILGAHGGDNATQRQFIDNTLHAASKKR